MPYLDYLSPESTKRTQVKSLVTKETNSAVHYVLIQWQIRPKSHPRTAASIMIASTTASIRSRQQAFPLARF